MKVLYKITYPNGKIYIGQDLTDTIDYFGSPSSKLIDKGFTREQRRYFTIRKEMLLELPDDTDNSEISHHEIALIVKHRSNDPSKGYNQTPRFNRHLEGGHRPLLDQIHKFMCIMTQAQHIHRQATLAARSQILPSFTTSGLEMARAMEITMSMIISPAP